MMSNTITLFNIPIQNISMQDALNEMMECLQKEGSRTVFFVNAHCVNISHRDETYLNLLQTADYVFADGVGMQLASRWLGKPLVDNVNGTDMYPQLCPRLAEKKASLYLLGAKPGIAEQMAHLAKQSHPGIKIAGYHHGYFDKNEEEQIIDQINENYPDILLVAMGVPAQEKWIARNAAKINARLIMGVGGLFDFYSGRIPRAPRWMRRTGLEWLYRFYQEPSRLWKRYLWGNIVFIWLIIKWRMKQQR